MRPPDREHPKADPALRATCLAPRCFRDAICGHFESDPPPGNRYCKEHRWKSWAWRVPLEPWRPLIEAETGPLIAATRAGEMPLHDHPAATGDDPEAAPGADPSLTWVAGVCGEWAAGLFYSARWRRGKGPGYDLQLFGGHRAEVKTHMLGKPWISVSVNRKLFPPRDPVIFCITDPKDFLNQTYVVATIEPSAFARAATNRGWGRTLEFTADDPWERPEMLLQDMLGDAALGALSGRMARIAKGEVQPAVVEALSSPAVPRSRGR